MPSYIYCAERSVIVWCSIIEHARKLMTVSKNKHGSDKTRAKQTKLKETERDSVREREREREKVREWDR